MPDPSSTESLSLFRTLDWSRPWYAAVRACGRRLAQTDDWRLALNSEAARQQLRNHRDLPLSFVPQQTLPDGIPYEAFISARGQVPTRDNLHDFFNALVWLTFPRIKSRLNALQATEIAHAASVVAPFKSRGPTRDAATLFDENAALVVLREGVRGSEMAQALRNHQWRHLFVEQAAMFGHDCRVVLFGHALMEKLATPYKAITAHAWLLTAGEEFFAMPPTEQSVWIDAAVARQLDAGLSPAHFTPLPILGVPGWSEQQDEEFYADTSVFRPKRNRVARA